MSAPDETPRWEVFSHVGHRTIGIDAVEYAREVVSRGAGELLVTSQDRDGTQAGYDLDLTRAIADAVSVPVIASGGAGSLDHLVDGVKIGHASAVLAASIFHYGTFTIGQVKHHMAKAGIPVRLDRAAASRLSADPPASTCRFFDPAVADSRSKCVWIRASEWAGRAIAAPAAGPGLPPE